MSRLRAMLLLVGTVVVGGTTYLIATPRDGITWAELADAGLAGRCTARLVECKARYACGRPRYAAVQTKAAVCDLPGAQGLVVFRWPSDGGVRCWESVGTPEESCRPVAAGCSDGTLCLADSNETMPVREESPACACRRATGTCTWDPDGPGPIPSGPAPFGATLAAGTWTGTGCHRKYCGPELAGEQGGSWPAECPQ
jgi:hypothetical protein